MVYCTSFERSYEGADACKHVHDDFLDISLELGANVSHPHEDQFFSKPNGGVERAKATYFHAYKTPLTFIALLGTKFLKEDSAKLILQVRHFSPKENFPQLEEIATYYRLTPQGTKEHTVDRRTGVERDY